MPFFIIFFRPLYLPARAFLSLGTLNVSSNIMAQTNSSVLRFVMEDAALYLSNRVSYGTVNLHRDYVCVLDIDLIELSLRLREKKQPTETSTKSKIEIAEIRSPFFELQASLNVVRLRTCADSCRLFLDLITYLADDGDFDEKGIAMSEDSSESGLMRSGLNSAVGGSLSSLHGQEVEAQVNDLMAEAMQDSSPVQQQRQQKVSSKEELVSKTTEVFFFPDENRTPIKKDNVITDQSEPCGVWHKEIDQQLMDDALDPACDDCPNTEEEFCILENDPGIGFTVSHFFPII
jgi:autophagy-related protein 2